MPDTAGASPQADALWRFSLAFYGRPKIAAAMLGLQDRHRLDVNLILYALWFGISGHGRLDTAAIASAEGAVGEVRHEIVEPLRHLRRALGSNPGADIQHLRERIKAVELDAEKVAQQRLAAQAGAAVAGIAAADRLAAAEANLTLYLGPGPAGGPEAQAIRAMLAMFVRERQEP